MNKPQLYPEVTRESRQVFVIRQRMSAFQPSRRWQLEPSRAGRLGVYCA